MSDLHVIFDLDDTLYAERDFAVSGFRAADAWAAAELGLSGLAADMERLLDAGHLGTLFGIVLEARLGPRCSAHLDQLVAAYRDHTPQIALFEESRAALDHFAGRARLGLITDGTVDVQARKVAALGIGARFDEIVFTHQRGGREGAKPNPWSFEHVATRLGRPGDRFVYVGDNPAKDFVAPNALGWTSVQVRRPTGIHRGKPVAAGGAPHIVIDSLVELAEAIG